MATTPLLKLTPFRTPTEQDRLQLIKAVQGELRARQWAALHSQQLTRQPTVVNAPVQSGSASSLSRSPVSLQYRIWTLQYGQQAQQKLSSPQEVANFFNRDGIDGRLLLIGEAGSGKTQTLAQLAAEFLQEANPKTGAIPVFIDLAGWQDETIVDVVVHQLWDIYRVPKNCATAWINTSQLIVMVDGFDVLPPPLQRKCATAIEAYLRGDLDRMMVLCCRRKALEQTGIGFNQFNGGVHIIPLVAQQVKDYIMAVGQPDTWQGVKGSKVLQQLARFPVLLNFVVACYTGQPIANRADLVQRYVQHCLTASSETSTQRRVDEATARRYLGWLAQQLESRNRSFYIESLTPRWLPSGSQLGVRLLTGLMIGLMIGIIGHPMVGLALGLITSQIDIDAFPRYRLSLSAISAQALPKVLLGVSIPMVTLAAVLGGVAAAVASPFGYGTLAFAIAASVGAIIGWGLGLAVQFYGGIQHSIQFRQSANQDIRAALRNTAWLFGVLAIVVMLFSVFPLMNAGQGFWAIITSTAVRTIGAIALASILWISYSLQHCLVRLMLISGGKKIPSNYAQFLDWATERRLLKKVGGSYTFIHESVRQYFARTQ